jgi:AcrR family transcriptional regulator
MARTIKEHEFAAKRSEILAAAQRLVFTKGYERMTIGDILAELKISSGAFYHYFDSKPAVLEALIEWMQQEAEKPLIPIVNDPNLTAPEKLQRFFAALDSSRSAQKTFLASLLQVWFADDNAIVRQKVDAAIIERRAPLLNTIIRQGLKEGVFSTSYPEQLGKVILSLALGMGNDLSRLFLRFAKTLDEAQSVDEIVAVYAAYTDAIERVLGAVPGFLYRPDTSTVKEWLEIL